MSTVVITLILASVCVGVFTIGYGAAWVAYCIVDKLLDWMGRGR